MTRTDPALSAPERTELLLGWGQTAPSAAHVQHPVMRREIEQSFAILAQVVDKIPPGEVLSPVKGMPPVGEAFVRLEQPRGEAVYYVRSNGTRNLERFRLRTPTFANIPSMVAALKGSDLADVPTIVLTIDPCISCTER